MGVIPNYLYRQYNVNIEHLKKEETMVDWKRQSLHGELDGQTHFFVIIQF